MRYLKFQPLVKMSAKYNIDVGFIVLGPDYFFGDPVQNHNGEEGFDRAAWFDKSVKNAAECVPRWLEAVKQIYGQLPEWWYLCVLGLLKTASIVGADAKYSAVGQCFTE